MRLSLVSVGVRGVGASIEQGVTAQPAQESGWYMARMSIERKALKHTIIKTSVAKRRNSSFCVWQRRSLAPLRRTAIQGQQGDVNQF